MYAAAGTAYDYSHASKPRPVGGGIAAQWAMTPKWFLSGEIAFQHNKPNYSPTFIGGEYDPEPWAYNQTSVPVGVGYYLSRPGAQTRLWIGMGLSFENCVNYYLGDNDDPYSSAELFRGIFLQNSFGVETHVDGAILSFQATASPFLAFQTRHWDFENYSAYPRKPKLHKDDGLGLHPMFINQARLRAQALIPLNKKQNLLLLAALDGHVRVWDAGMDDNVVDTEGATYLYLGLNAGLAYKL